MRTCAFVKDRADGTIAAGRRFHLESRNGHFRTAFSWFFPPIRKNGFTDSCE
jgi:hypothetical protein